MNKDFTILLAEDNDEEVIIMQSAFVDAGWTRPLVRVQDGREAIAYLGGQDQFADRKRFPYPTLLLLDLWMPNGNGFDVLKWVRDQPTHRALLVFMLTFEENEEMSRQAYDLAVNCLISKPRDYKEMVSLATRLNTYLNLIQIPPHPEF